MAIYNFILTLFALTFFIAAIILCAEGMHRSFSFLSLALTSFTCSAATVAFMAWLETKNPNRK